MKRLTAALCLAEVLGMVGFATFPALLPTFQEGWRLSNTDAGWISGVYLGGYMVSVPVLSSLTDRVDARRVYAGGILLGGLAALGYALLAEGFWTAMIFRAIGGVGLAGTYMPGLKILSDHIQGPNQSRFVSVYTANFSIGAGLSYFLAGVVAGRLGWSAAFVAAALGSLAALLVVVVAVPPAPHHAATRPGTRLLDFRPVLRARAAMGYVLGYGAHMWELFALRSWIVAFLFYSQSLQPAGARIWSATVIAALIHILQMLASIAGNELAVRFGRRRALVAVMSASVLLSLGVGFSARLPFAAVTALVLLYGFTMSLDSAALTAGALAAAPTGYRGATMAVHSTVGFGMGFVGSLAVGVVLDMAGATPGLGWGLAFALMGLGCALGPIALMLLGRPRAARVSP